MNQFNFETMYLAFFVVYAHIAQGGGDGLNVTICPLFGVTGTLKTLLLSYLVTVVVFY